MKISHLFSLICLSGTLFLNSHSTLAQEPESEEQPPLETRERLAAFSPNGRYYIYLESYPEPLTKIPKAYLQIVRTDKNKCVEKGCIETDLTDDFSGKALWFAEEDMLQKTRELREELNVNRQFKKGLELEILEQKNLDKGLDRTVAKFNSKGDNIIIFLQQRHIKSVVNNGRGDIDRSALRLVAFFDYRRLTLGSLYEFKEGVSRFAIREIYLSPDKKTIVVLLDMFKPTIEGEVKTTLVQSFPIEKKVVIKKIEKDPKDKDKTNKPEDTQKKPEEPPKEPPKQP
jgi:hypothetical protein